jgi:hypothetical protein
VPAGPVDRQRGVGGEVEGGRRQAGRDDLGAQGGDHRPVVGAQPGPGHPQFDAGRRAPLLGEGAQPRVGGHPPADHQVLHAVGRARVDGLAGEHVDHGLLERRRDVGHPQRAPGAVGVLDPAGDGGLQPGEREVVGAVAPLAAREPDRLGVALAGGAVDGRPARVGQVEQAGDLVVGLARGVVDGVAERPHLGGEVLDQQQRRVPARHQQRHGGLGQRAVLQLVDGDVAHQVVHPVQGLAERHGVRLGGRHPHQQGARQAGPGGDRDGVDVGHAHPGGVERPPHGGGHGLQVGAAGDLGDDAAEAGVLVDAGGDLVAQQLAAADQAHPGLVTGGLDAQDQGLVTAHRAVSSSAGAPGAAGPGAVRRITIASASM